MRIVRLVSTLVGCKPHRTVAQARLRSSFIYLANAVSDLSGNWATLALVLAPLVLASSLCLLPDALNLQARVATVLSGGKSVEFHHAAPVIGVLPVQEPYHPEASLPPNPYPDWLIETLHIIAALITIVALYLVVLCLLSSIKRRAQLQLEPPGIIAESIDTYRHAIDLLPAFFWVRVLQIAPIAIGTYLLGFFLFAIPGGIIYVWVYPAVFALVFDDRHGFGAVTHSYELIRGRFFKVAIRIIVFIAVFSGYNAWTSLCFVIASHFLGPVAAYTGFIWGIMFALDILSVAVAYITIAFFAAAGVRLYQDLTVIAQERATAASEARAMQPTGPLTGAADV